MKLLPVKEYVADATHAIEHAKRRVYILTMMLNDDESTNDLLDAVRQAAERGLEVVVAGDTYTFTEINGHIRLGSPFNSRYNSARRLRRSFKKSKAEFVWLGNGTFMFLSGRTHTKWLVVDDTVYSFGGVNLYMTGINATDYMFKTTNQIVADRLVAEQRRIIKAAKNVHAYRSHSFGDDMNCVLIDGGFIGDSIIYRHACHLIEQAKKVTFVSQYCPNGRLGRLLKKTDSTLYFNPWNQATALNALFIRFMSALTGFKTTYTRKPYIHSKYIVCTMPDGSKIAITGSHNFSQGSVWFGTREVALETRDPAIIKQLERFTKDYIA